MSLYTTLVLDIPHIRDFAAARNALMTQCKTPWVFFIDTDETLVGTIDASQLDAKYGAYTIRRIDIFYGKELRYGEIYDAAHRGIVRVVKVGAGTWKGKVHETFHTTRAIGSLPQVYIVHHAHKNITAFLHKINNYSSLRAEELIKTKKLSRLTLTIQMVVYPISKFCYTFIWKQGFRDGPEGFIYAFMMAFHSFLVRAKAIVYGL